MDTQALKAIVEAVIYAAEEPVTVAQLAEVLGLERGDVEPTVAALRAEYEAPGRGLRLGEVAGGLRFFTRPDYHPWIKILFKNQRSVRLSQQALQTLAIIAYKQPITAPEIEDIRTVDSASILKNLLDKRLVKVLGRKDVVGRPMMYGTTREFLLQFGLKDLAELPRLEEFEELLKADLRTSEAAGEAAAETAAEARAAQPQAAGDTPAGDTGTSEGHGTAAHESLSDEE